MKNAVSTCGQRSCDDLPQHARHLGAVYGETRECVSCEKQVPQVPRCRAGVFVAENKGFCARHQRGTREVQVPRS
jgi:hypothetical protein